MELYDDFKIILRRVYEIEQESNVAQYSLKPEKAKRVINNYDSYIPMANKIKKMQNKEIQMGKMVDYTKQNTLMDLSMTEW